jgi:hypothetical protein
VLDRSHLSRFYRDPDGGAFLASDLYVSKRGNTDNVQPIESQKPPGDRGCLHGLVNSSCSNCLDVGTAMFADDTSNGSSDCRGPGLRGDSDNIHHLGASLLYP